MNLTDPGEERILLLEEKIVDWDLILNLLPLSVVLLRQTGPSPAPPMSNMSTNKTADHCNTPSQTTYQIFSWVMVMEFILALPLNLSVLYIFIFR